MFAEETPDDRLSFHDLDANDLMLVGRGYALDGVATADAMLTAILATNGPLEPWQVNCLRHGFDAGVADREAYAGADDECPVDNDRDTENTECPW